MGLSNLPGVKAERPPREPMTARERINRLKAAGEDTSWYDRHPSRHSEPLETVKVGERCSVYHLFVAEKGSLHTAHYATGEPYAQVQKLKTPVLRRYWLCLVCRSKWESWDEAKTHAELTKQDT